MSRPVLLAVWLIASLAGSLGAQVAPVAEVSSQVAPADSADALLLDHDFTSGAGEFVRVFLQAKQVYRAELSSPELTLEIRSPVQSVPRPRVYPFLPTDAPSGFSIVEVYPDVDATYEIRTVSANGSAVATKLRLYRDVRASDRRSGLIAHPGWQIGVELAGGWHSGLAHVSGTVPTTSDQHAGSDVEACFTARQKVGRAGLCVIGIGFQSQSGASSILWFYTEPRFALIGPSGQGRSAWEAGILFRAGVGSIERRSTSPWIFAPGVYVARQIGSSGQTTRWRIQGSYSHGWFSGFPTVDTTGTWTHSDRLTLGFGWYQ